MAAVGICIVLLFSMQKTLPWLSVITGILTASWLRSPIFRMKAIRMRDPSNSSAGIMALAVLVLKSHGKEASSKRRWNQKTDRFAGVGSEESQPPM